MRHDVIPLCAHSTEILLHFSDNAVSADETIVCFTNQCGSTLLCSALSSLGPGNPRGKDNYEFPH
ncbi:MAG: hypothetical protein QOF70_1962 [Acetobacteraceae bacterium]|nr:hypothetical protein [Acetobacteraceae bacterium]